jgi:hypothetical protein
MTSDKPRNDVFRRAIRQAPGGKWLEIGFGAHLSLSRIVLKEKEGVDLTALEANPEAFLAGQHLAKKLKLNNLTLLCVRSETYMNSDELADISVVISEVIGNIASQEGAAVILQDFQGKGLTHIPRYAATFFSPCNMKCITRHVKDRSTIYDGRTFLLLETDLMKSSMSDMWAPAEFFDFQTGKYSQHEQEFAFTCKKSGVVDCFAMFVWVGMNDDGQRKSSRLKSYQAKGYPYGYPIPLPSPTLSFSSLWDDGMSATNWFHVVVRVPTPIRVTKGQKLSVSTNFKYDEHLGEKLVPSYSFTVGEQQVCIPYDMFTQDYERRE